MHGISTRRQPGQVPLPRPMPHAFSRGCSLAGRHHQQRPRRRRKRMARRPPGKQPEPPIRRLKLRRPRPGQRRGRKGRRRRSCRPDPRRRMRSPPPGRGGMEAQLHGFRDRDPAPDFPVAFCSCGDKLGFGEGPLATIRSNTQTGIRPEFTSQPDGGEVVDEVELLRAAVYSLLARLLVRAPDAALLREVAGIGGNDDDAAPLASARAALAEAAAKADPGEVEREYFTLFVGVGRGELLPYASYYRTGFLNERPLAELRRDLARI